MHKHKNTLKSHRLTLKHTKPSKQMAKTMFALVDGNRSHLQPWFPWVHLTHKVADSMAYLQKKEEDFCSGKKIEYGIYLHNTYCGNISLFDINYTHKSAEIGYWIGASLQGHGYVTEAVQRLVEYGFTDMKLNRIQIRCNQSNIASAKVAQKNGFTQEGMLRQFQWHASFGYYNALIFSILADEYIAPKKLSQKTQIANIMAVEATNIIQQTLQ